MLTNNTLVIHIKHFTIYPGLLAFSLSSIKPLSSKLKNVLSYSHILYLHCISFFIMGNILVQKMTGQVETSVEYNFCYFHNKKIVVEAIQNVLVVVVMILKFHIYVIIQNTHPNTRNKCCSSFSGDKYKCFAQNGFQNSFFLLLSDTLSITSHIIVDGAPVP